MDDTLDNTTLSTISLLESRLLRIEQILYGQSDTPQTIAPEESASVALAELERRYGLLLRHFRVYSELVKIYKSHPSLFQPPPPESPPIDLSPEALRATVLSYASSFPSIASALTAVTSDTPIPDPKLSADLASLLPRMKAVEATQLAQESDISELRVRSERVMRAWYETRVLRYGKFVASAESRCEKVEMGIRRQERLRDMDSAI